MRKWAEIQNGIVRCLRESADDFIPELAAPLSCVEVTGFDPLPSEGAIYEDGGFRAPTSEEIDARHRPAFEGQRNRLFSETEWVRQRHEDRIALEIDDSVNWTAWLTYWQALRDMPEAADFDPQNPIWPGKPE